LAFRFFLDTFEREALSKGCARRCMPPFHSTRQKGLPEICSCEMQIFDCFEIVTFALPVDRNWFAQGFVTRFLSGTTAIPSTA